MKVLLSLYPKVSENNIICEQGNELHEHLPAFLYVLSINFLLSCFFSGYRLIGTHSGVKLCRWTKVFWKMNY